MTTPAPEHNGAGDPPLISQPLTVMMGEAETVVLSGNTYQLGPLITKNVTKCFGLLMNCPAVLVAQAYAGKDDTPLDLSKCAEIFNQLTARNGDDPDKLPFDDSQYASALASLPNVLSDEAVEAMYQPLLLALQRHHPELTQADLEDDFDFGTFVRTTRAILRINTGLREAF